MADVRRKVPDAEVRKMIAMAALIVLAAFLLSGCTGFWSGFGGDGSRLTINQGCDVELRQNALVDGNDDAKMMEKVVIDNDCNVEVLFEQNVGTSSEEVMNQ